MAKIKNTLAASPAPISSDTVFEFMPDDFTLRGEADTLIDTNFSSQNFWLEVRHRFFSNKGAVIALVLVTIIAVFAAFGPMMTEYSYSEQTLSQKNLAPRIPGLENLGIFDGEETLKTTTGNKKINGYENPETEDVYYWFGSDVLGRDIWTRVWEGTRVSLGIAFVAAIIDMIIGMSYGLISGYFGGRVDNIMQRISEIINGIPRLVIVTLLMLILPRGFWTIVFALMITEWIGMSRIARAEMLKLKEQEFVLASRTLGAKDFFIIFKEILPNIIAR